LDGFGQGLRVFVVVDDGGRCVCYCQQLELFVFHQLRQKRQERIFFVFLLILLNILFLLVGGGAEVIELLDEEVHFVPWE
jgi:hypothetical protein